MRLPSMLALSATLLVVSACSDPSTVPTDPSSLSLDLITVPPTTAMRCGESLVVAAKATNKSGHGAVADLLLNFNVLAGGGSMFGGATLTNDQGLASDIWTLGLPDIPNTMAVRAVDAAGSGTTYATMTITPLSQIAFDNSGRIVVENSDGSNPTYLTAAASKAAFPDYSPDGSKIAFFSDLPGPGGIYVMNADGSDAVNVTNALPAPDTVRYGRPAWSPDGRKIAFVMTQGDPGNYIGVMNADGSGLTQLTFPVTCGPRTCYGTEADPSWSPDGTRIAFGRMAAIWVMNSDGSDQTALTDENVMFALQPAWSPDGTRIAFAASIEGGDGADEKVYVMRSDGALAKNVTGNLDVPGSYPAWSPDGTRIAFVEAVNFLRQPFFDGRIGVINADGSNWTELPDNPKGNHPAWTTGCLSQ